MEIKGEFSYKIKNHLTHKIIRKIKNDDCNSQTDINDIFNNKFDSSEGVYILCEFINHLFEDCIDLIKYHINLIEENYTNCSIFHKTLTDILDKIYTNFILNKHKIYINMFNIINIWINDELQGKSFIKLYMSKDLSKKYFLFE